jgi:Mce-associated membrane protein
MTEPRATEPTADEVSVGVRAELAEALRDLEAAEAAEAQARAEATRAKARAAGLHEEPPARLPRRLTALRPRLVVAGAGLLAGAGAALIALMLWQHHRAAAQQARDGEFVEAARAGVVALLSIDHSHARDDVQRVLDLSTGAFRGDFQSRADDFVKTAQASKAVTKGSVKAAALEWAHADSGAVLVAASSQVTNSSGARDDPRPWRMSITVTRDGGQLKMSDVEFVP